MEKRIAVMIFTILCLVGGFTMGSFATPAVIFNDVGFCDNETGSLVVLTNSKNNNTLFTCRGSFPGYSAKKAVVNKDAAICEGILGSGAKGGYVLRPNGSFMVNCHNKS